MGQFWPAGWALCGVAACALATLGCATEEQVEFGDPARVAGGFGTGSSSSGGECSVDPTCRVSWRIDIYEAIFTTDLGGAQPSGACGESSCHDEGAGGLFFPKENSDEAFFQLTSYELTGGRPYVVPCEPTLSHIVCNLKFEEGIDNPYIGPDEEFTGGCGSPMPKTTETIKPAALNQDQLDVIAEWVACGAPQN